MFKIINLALTKTEAEFALSTPEVLLTLRRILASHEHDADDSELKKALRDFLAQQDDENKYTFSNNPIDLLFVTIAEEIAQENEPIISLLVPGINADFSYMDDTIDANLQEFSEEFNGKRRLKNLAQFILSDDRKRLIACQQSVNAAVRIEKGAEFKDQTYPNAKVLSATELQRLIQWDPDLVKQCTDYLSHEEPLWVTTQFHTAHEQSLKDRLLFELELLVECLFNGGVTRRGLAGQDLMAEGNIAKIGIDRFYKIWMALPQDVRLEWDSKEFNFISGSELYQSLTETFTLGPLLYRLFGSIPNLPECESKTLSLTAPYKDLECIEMIAKRLQFGCLDTFKDPLSDIEITPPEQAIVLKDEWELTRRNEKQTLTHKLLAKFTSENPTSTTISNPDDPILKLAHRQSNLDFQKFSRDRRANGFQHHIMFLRQEPDTTGPGWTLRRGLLTVNLPYDTDHLMDFLEAKLAHISTYQTRAKLIELQQQGAIIATPELPNGFENYPYHFKTLPNWGKNHAMDIGTFMINVDGSISLQVMVRPGHEQYALLGSMKNPGGNEDAFIVNRDFVFKNLYGHDLFTDGSATLDAALDIHEDRLSLALTNALQITLNSNSRLNPFADQIIEAVQRSNGDFITTFAELKRVLTALQSHNIPQQELECIWLMIKCELYAELFPERYLAFSEILSAKKVEMPETINEADFRNTQSAFMCTTPYYFFLHEHELQEHQDHWLLKKTVGNVASRSKFIKLEELFDKPTFSAHARIALTMLADMAQKNPSVVNHPNVQRQLKSIKEKIIQRERQELYLDNHTSSSATTASVHHAARYGQASSSNINAAVIQYGSLSNN